MAVAAVTTNPILTNMEGPESSEAWQRQNSGSMSLTGTIYATGVLLALVASSAALSWKADMIYGQSQDRMMPILEVFLLCFPAPFLLVWLTIRNKAWSPITAPISAILQGTLLGYASAVFEYRFPGIVVQSVFLTIAIGFGLLVAYRTSLIRVGASSHRKLMAALCGVLLYYVANAILVLLHVRELPMLTAGIPGVAVSIAVVVIASVRLVASFDAAVNGANDRYPKYMDWYVALGLTVALVWLYLETLVLLSKSRKVAQ